MAAIADDKWDIPGSSIKILEPEMYKRLRPQGTEAVYDYFIEQYGPYIDENRTKEQNLDEFIDMIRCDSTYIYQFKCSGRYLVLTMF